MHDYAVFGHNRATIGRYLGIASIFIAAGVASLITWLKGYTGYQALNVTIATGVVYFILHWLFNNYAWKIPFFKIPNFTGLWIVKGTTLHEDGSTRFEWEAEIDIEQTWEQMVVALKTKQSGSESYTATISKLSGSNAGWQLSYSYRNNPNIDEYHDMQSHKGYCEIDFDKDLKVGSAAYFNNNGRRTFGKMELTRK